VTATTLRVALLLLVGIGASCTAHPVEGVTPNASAPPAPTTATQATTSAPPTASAPAAASASPAQEKGVRPIWTRPGTEDTELRVEALGFLRIGARVRLKKRDRALDPEETGHTARLAYGPGQEGEVVRFVHRRIPKVGAEFDIAVIRWDAQSWFEWDIPLNRMVEGKVYSADDIDRMNRESGKPVQLGSFEAAAHPETLQWIGGTAMADVGPPADRSSGKPTHTHCKPPLRAVPGSYIVLVRDAERTQEIADDLKQRHKINIRRVWPALSSLSVEMSSAALAQILKDERLRDVQDNCF
jgi:hypothetical protein